MIFLKAKTKHLLGLTAVLILGLAVGSGKPFFTSPTEKVTSKNLEQRIISAKTAEDHKAIADYYYAGAAAAQAKMTKHEKMAAAYKRAGFGTVSKIPNAPGTIEHCNNLVARYKALVADLAAMAKLHEDIASRAQ